jgi:hypothetical protein
MKQVDGNLGGNNSESGAFENRVPRGENSEMPRSTDLQNSLVDSAPTGNQLTDHEVREVNHGEVSGTADSFELFESCHRLQTGKQMMECPLKHAVPHER